MRTAPQEPADAVDAKGIQRVVIAEFALEQHRAVAHDARGRADEESPPTATTKPLAGVMATRPATRPEAKPREVGRPCFIHSAMSQASPPAAAAICVVVKATAATPKSGC